MFGSFMVIRGFFLEEMITVYGSGGMPIHGNNTAGKESDFPVIRGEWIITYISVPQGWYNLPPGSMVPYQSLR